MIKKTNWDAYYGQSNKASSITRDITTKKIAKIIEDIIFLDNKWHPENIIEIGGANSCFYEAMKNNFKPAQYLVIDNNQTGLDLLKSKVGDDGVLLVRNADILDNTISSESADLVYSVGLIEHFDSTGTEKAIAAHFTLLKNGGYCIITFPTPTILYKLARKVSESLNLWLFWDERPLHFDEVINIASKYGDVLKTSINWAIIFTQGIIVVKKHE
jgi:SAM-dependent methyltransferase